MKSPRTIVVNTFKDVVLAYRRLWDDVFNIFNGDVSITGDLTVGGSVVFGGGVNFFYRAITALRTLDDSDYQIECMANSFTVTLPTAVGIQGRTYSIKNSGTGTITVAGDGTETIDGELTRMLTNRENLVIMSNNAGWIIL
jgi:hypothetical protein